MSDYGKILPDNSFDYSSELPELLTRYANDNFQKTKCVYEYSNRINGESAHSMKIHYFQEGHTLIEHTYWESNSTELRLKDVRISEVYYLIHQFVKDTGENILQLDDSSLRNPNAYKDWTSCVGELVGNGCGIELYKDSENDYTIIFDFPCC